MWFLNSLRQEEKEKEYYRTLNHMLEQIRRHVDDIRFAEIKFDQKEVCSHCGNTWTEDEGNCNECCQKEIDEYELRVTAATKFGEVG